MAESDGPTPGSIKSKVLQNIYRLAEAAEFGNKIKSIVWKTFRFIEDEDGRKLLGYVCCKQCKAILTYAPKNGTSNLYKHKCVNKSLQTENKPISDFFKASNDIKSKLTQGIKQDMQRGAVAFTVLDMRPMHALFGHGLATLLSIFTCIGFKYGYLTPELCAEILPHPTTISRNILNMANDLIPKLSDLVRPAFSNIGGGITIDIWTDDCRKQSFMSLTVTAHFVDESFHLHDRVLATHHIPAGIQKTGENLRKEIFSLMRKFQIFDALNKNPRRVLFTTDRGSNIICGLKENERLNCFIHLLNNICKQMCKVIEDSCGILETCRSVVSYIKRLGLNDFKNGALKMSVATRFNTNHDMLESISVNFDEIVELLESKNAAEKLCDLNKETIEKLVEFLQLFRTATVETEASKRPTLFLVQLWTKILFEHLRDKASDHQLIVEMKEIGRDYFRQIENSVTKYHKYAVFAHPLFKSLKCLPSYEHDEIVNDVSFYF